jgi:osmoprotectant transport system permease protein
LLIGHTNRGAFLAINIGNAGRSLPTFGLLSLIVTLVGLGQVPLILALVVLAVPPMLTTTYAGLRAVDPAAVDSARGMGMRPLQILFRAEVPIALPLILSGVRSAALQVVATATVAAYVGLGGLGRLLVDGLSLNQYDRVVAGAVLVATLAIVIDLFGGLVQRLVVSPGVTGTHRIGTFAQSSPTTPEKVTAPAERATTP